jgi:hypothetical protein
VTDLGVHLVPCLVLVQMAAPHITIGSVAIGYGASRIWAVLVTAHHLSIDWFELLQSGRLRVRRSWHRAPTSYPSGGVVNMIYGFEPPAPPSFFQHCVVCEATTAGLCAAVALWPMPPEQVSAASAGRSGECKECWQRWQRVDGAGEWAGTVGRAAGGRAGQGVRGQRASSPFSATEFTLTAHSLHTHCALTAHHAHCSARASSPSSAAAASQASAPSGWCSLSLSLYSLSHTLMQVGLVFYVAVRWYRSC